MRIGILSQWFDPEPGPASLPGVLARGLLSRGHDVQVLTGFPNYPTGVVAPGYRIRRRWDENLEGVAVRRVALYPNHGASAIRRFANYASFGVSALASGLGALRGLDALWVYCSPITVAWPMWAARYGLRVPVVAHILDLWPDTVLASGFLEGDGHLVAKKVLNTWCNGMYRSAHSVAYISPGVGKILRQRGVPADKLTYVPMWADETIFRSSPDNLRDDLGLAADAVVLLYAGALGEAQGLDALIEACALVTDPRFVCLIAGSGTADGALREQAQKIGAHNVRFLGRLPSSAMTALMATGDINFIGLRPHPLSAVTMPSKTQAAMASGRAVLAAADGDVAQVITDSGAGWAVPSGDVRAIAAAIGGACQVGRSGLHKMGAASRAYYERTFSVDQGVRSVEALLYRAAETKGVR